MRETAAETIAYALTVRTKGVTVEQAFAFPFCPWGMNAVLEDGVIPVKSGLRR